MIKMADTCKPLGQFAVAEASDISVTIDGTTKMLQTAIDNGEIGGGSSTFVGTHADWDSLLDAEKAKYEFVDFTDDYAGNIPISNRNLLDNPFFTVNQRGVTSLTTEGYFSDRWKMGIDIGTINIVSNGVKIDSTTKKVTIYQKNEANVVSQLSNKILTMSIDFTPTTIGSGVRLYVNNDTTSSGGLTTLTNDLLDGTTVNVRTIKKFTFIAPAFTSNSALFWLYSKLGNTFIIHSVKLELGSVSTLANDVAPNYGEELRKCQRYFITIPEYARYRMSVYNTNVMDFNVPLPVTMRANPTIVNPSVLAIYNLNTSNTNKTFTYTSELSSANPYTTLLIRATSNAHGLKDGCLYLLGGDLQLSADL